MDFQIRQCNSNPFFSAMNNSACLTIRFLKLTICPGYFFSEGRILGLSEGCTTDGKTILIYSHYHPQRSWGKVIFSEACVHILPTGQDMHGYFGGHVWLLPGRACMVALGGMCGCSWGACVVKGGMHGKGACMVKGGMHGKGGHACPPT